MKINNKTVLHVMTVVLLVLITATVSIPSIMTAENPEIIQTETVDTLEANAKSTTPIMTMTDKEVDDDKKEDLADEMAALDKELAAIKASLAALGKDKQSALNTQAHIDAVIAELDAQQVVLTEKITSEKNNLVVTQKALDLKIISINEEERLLEARMVAMYKKGGQGILTSVLGAEDFSEILTTTEYMQRVAVSDAELVEKLNNDRIAIELEEAAINKLLEQLAVTEKELEDSLVAEAAARQANDKNLSAIDAKTTSEKEQQSEIQVAYANAKVAFDALAWSDPGNEGDFDGQYLWPVSGFNHISSYYGPRVLWGRPDYHTGIDIAGGGSNIYGAGIQASAGGQVVLVGYNPGGYGNYVIVDHAGGHKTLYGHASSVLVSQGQTVRQGDTIARVGSTGNSSGNHLHFEIRVNNKHTNPMAYLQA